MHNKKQSCMYIFIEIIKKNTVKYIKYLSDVLIKKNQHEKVIILALRMQLENYHQVYDLL